MSDSLLVVLAGLPGTGKTTLARQLAAMLHGANLRIDAIETAVIRCGLAEPPLGAVGYVIAHELAAGTLDAGTPVVVDAVNPVPAARAGWRDLAAQRRARLVVLETVINDEAEHRRRIAARKPDLTGQSVPTWQEVKATGYVPWDESRDGPRLVVDMTDSASGIRKAVQLLST